MLSTVKKFYKFSNFELKVTRVGDALRAGMVQSANSPFSLQMCRLKVFHADSVESAILQIVFPPFDPGN